MNAIKKRFNWWPLILIASAGGAVLVEVGNIATPFRPAIVFWFFLVCPGMALVRLLRIADRVAELTVAIALSITLDTIVAEAMVLTKRWSPEWALVLLAIVSIVGALLQVIPIKSNATSHEIR